LLCIFWINIIIHDAGRQEPRLGFFNAELKFENRRLEAIKEQILIRYLGCGWEDAHHPWSKDHHQFTSAELLEHLCEVVIPMSTDGVHKVPPEPPLDLPHLPVMQATGKASTLAELVEKASDDKLEAIKERARNEKASREERGEGDPFSENQRSTPPKMETIKKGYKIEAMFSYTGLDGNPSLGWYNGVVSGVENINKCPVRIQWNKDCMGVKDAGFSMFKLVQGNWNPKRGKKGAWREYLS